MGFPPEAVDRMGLWQFMACVDGWNKAQGADERLQPPTPEEFHDMVQRLH